MADTEEEAAAAVQRLEAALERIAAAVVRRRVATFSETEKIELATRLDALIAQLRAVLDGAAASAGGAGESR